MARIENYGNTKGWWFYIELLIAEQKSQMPETYEFYCQQFADFLAASGPSDKKTKKGVPIIHGSR